jgi:hypothetical protein
MAASSSLPFIYTRVASTLRIRKLCRNCADVEWYKADNKLIICSEKLVYLAVCRK